ncbi:MAG TPA: PilZ domain-containing protein [Pyrinomonadaceae bacterium]
MRSIIARLRGAVGNRRRARRYRARLPVRISLLDVKPVAESAIARRPPEIKGHTRDLSATGLGIVVTSIRVGEYYLTGAGRRLLVTLEHPKGPLAMEVVPVRYEQLDGGDAEATGYLIGAQIRDMSDSDRARLNAYLEEKE